MRGGDIPGLCSALVQGSPDLTKQLYDRGVDSCMPNGDAGISSPPRSVTLLGALMSFGLIQWGLEADVYYGMAHVLLAAGSPERLGFDNASDEPYSFDTLGLEPAHCVDALRAHLQLRDRAWRPSQPSGSQPA